MQDAGEDRDIHARVRQARRHDVAHLVRLPGAFPLSPLDRARRNVHAQELESEWCQTTREGARAAAQVDAALANARADQPRETREQAAISQTTEHVVIAMLLLEM